jgi:hypothetical protein
VGWVQGVGQDGALSEQGVGGCAGAWGRPHVL